jgi:tRNA-dihydrouridine synthase
MFEECIIRGRRFAPARFCAPLVGYTHSAFRRLLAELGGCGAVWTEMLAARQILSENFEASPWVRRRSHETNLVHQLMMSSADPVDRVLCRLEAAGAQVLDLNLGCHAWSVRSCAAGVALFEDLEALRQLVPEVRRRWPHVFTVKIRLGRERPDWQPRFVERVRLLEDAGVDAITLHARFAEEKFRRRARHELFPWVASLTRLPLIANGDLTGPEMFQGREREREFESVKGVMIGRMAIARPWLFANWDQPGKVDLAGIWDRMSNYIMEDFPPAMALRRLQMFNKYFAANFKFGHQFNVELARAPSVHQMRLQAQEFFARSPETVPEPMVAGL